VYIIIYGRTWQVVDFDLTGFFPNLSGLFNPRPGGGWLTMTWRNFFKPDLIGF
jgi:hypothetical protein